jgi:FAD/FMN-containing dehydrogenase
MEHALRTLSDQIATARAAGTPLCLRGGGSKDFLGTASGERLDSRGLNGVISYEPTELVVTVGSGTPLAELEALLAEQGQCLAFEPPHYPWSASGASPATVGGMVASGLAGPSRASMGGVRDYVLGVKLINGLGQHLTFGGQVMKNVAGYDVSRLMVGARGTLGLLTEISLKVLPVAPAEATLCFALAQHEALEHLHRWGGEPLPLNASCWVMAPNPGSARPPEGVQSHLGRPGVGLGAPNPGFARPPEGVQSNLGRPGVGLGAPNPGFARPPEGVQSHLGRPGAGLDAPIPGSARPPEGVQSHLGRPGVGLMDIKPSLYVRLRGAVAAVEAACQRMLAEAPGERMDNAQTKSDWTLCRNQQLPFFTTRPQADAVLWRLSVPQTTPVLPLPGQPLIEWQGGLRWLWAPLSAGAELQALARAAGGSAALFVNPAATALESAATATQGLRSDSPTQHAISQRLKASFDPQGIFNPGLVS